MFYRTGSVIKYLIEDAYPVQFENQLPYGKFINCFTGTQTDTIIYYYFQLIICPFFCCCFVEMITLLYFASYDNFQRRPTLNQVTQKSMRALNMSITFAQLTKITYKFVCINFVLTIFHILNHLVSINTIKMTGHITRDPLF